MCSFMVPGGDEVFSEARRKEDIISFTAGHSRCASTAPREAAIVALTSGVLSLPHPTPHPTLLRSRGANGWYAVWLIGGESHIGRWRSTNANSKTTVYSLPAVRAHKSNQIAGQMTRSSGVESGERGEKMDERRGKCQTRCLHACLAPFKRAAVRPVRPQQAYCQKTGSTIFFFF